MTGHDVVDIVGILGIVIQLGAVGWALWQFKKICGKDDENNKKDTK